MANTKEVIEYVPYGVSAFRRITQACSSLDTHTKLSGSAGTDLLVNLCICNYEMSQLEDLTQKTSSVITYLNHSNISAKALIIFSKTTSKCWKVTPKVWFC